ncbi:putative signal peptide protein [Puccinia sorghi]|uniref:Putative signal peptide protein n=1 Tax=Puccinia sorghi TaxID=27349 RepID=A0A0L6V923_9BASI|nr:putative signal peptide protein [Puccinia sorghi]
MGHIVGFLVLAINFEVSEGAKGFLFFISSGKITVEYYYQEGSHYYGNGGKAKYVKLILKKVSIFLKVFVSEIKCNNKRLSSSAMVFLRYFRDFLEVLFILYAQDFQLTPQLTTLPDHILNNPKCTPSKKF